MLIKRFSDIIAWQKAHDLVLYIYKISKNLPESEKFGLIGQIRRAVVSIPANIAEGFKRKTKKDSIHFYNIAQGSLEEVRYYVLLCKDLSYFSEEEYNFGAEKTEETAKILQGWINVQK